MREIRKAKFMDASLAAWLIIVVCSLHLVCANDGASKATEIKHILDKPNDYITDGERKMLYETAKRALSVGSDDMDIDQALDAISRLSLGPFIQFDHELSGHLVNFKRISPNECNKDSFIEGFAEAVFFTKQKLYPKLYEYGRDAFNRYIHVCGLQDRCKKLVKHYASSKSGQSDEVEKVSIGDLLIGAMRPDEIACAMFIVRDPSFSRSLRGEIDCDNKDFIAKIYEGVRAKDWFGRLEEYVNYVFDNYLLKCGHEARFQSIAGEMIKREADKGMSLASYLKGPAHEKEGKDIVPLIEYIDNLASVKAIDLESCSVDVAQELVKRIGPIPETYYYKIDLSKYAKSILEKHFSHCGYRGQFLNKLGEFENKRVEFKLLEKFVDECDRRTLQGTESDKQAVVDKYIKGFDPEFQAQLQWACRKMWNETYAVVADLALLDSLKLHHSGKYGNYLGHYVYCSIVLGENNSYLGKEIAHMRLFQKEAFPRI